MTSLSQTWFWQQWHLVLVLCLIALIALNFLSRFVLPALQLKGRLAQVLSKVEGLKAGAINGAIDLDKLESEAMTEPRMAHLWAQYAHCLHVPWDDLQVGQTAAGPQNRVRVLSAGPSVELCGGTHVSATGDIGIIKVISEGSVGANLRRIEAVAGTRTLNLLQNDRRLIADAARLVGSGPDDLMIGVQRRVDDIKGLQDENKTLRSRLAISAASELATNAVDGIVIAQVDDLTPGDLRDLTIAVRQQPNVHTVVLIGVSPGGGVSLVGAVDAASGKNASQLITTAAKAVGGGGGGKGDIATAGGKNPEGIPEALRLAQEAARS